jgi:hypothetical protein
MSGQKMREVVESGFQVTVSEKDSFRFCECATYQTLSGLNLQEMDVGWWDATTKEVIVMELKGREVWANFDKSKSTAHEHLVSILIGKATDTLLMLSAVWVETESGIGLKTALPALFHSYPGKGKLKLIFLLDTPPSRTPLLLALKDEVNKRLAGRLRLFGGRVTIVDFAGAQKQKLPVEREVRPNTN